MGTYTTSTPSSIFTSSSNTFLPSASTTETLATRNPPVVYTISQSSATISSAVSLSLSSPSDETGRVLVNACRAWRSRCSAS